jgi:hypothetical protein
MKWQIALGALSVAATVIVLAFVGVGEPRRMANFTTSYNARQIETGALIFENNCRPCHGPQGKGIEGPGDQRRRSVQRESVEGDRFRRHGARLRSGDDKLGSAGAERRYKLSSADAYVVTGFWWAASR